MSRTIEEFKAVYSGDVRKNIVSISELRDLLIWPMLLSNSKSADVLKPLRI